MRTYVCGQCHVEYYFKGEAEAAHLSLGARASRWTASWRTTRRTGTRTGSTPARGAPVLKAQHPEFEMYNQGIHARSGVACADCHMPYERRGALKISDHHVRSPLLNIDHACQTCHKVSEEELRERVYTIQDRTFETAEHRDRRAARPDRRHRAGPRRPTAPIPRLASGPALPARGPVLSPTSWRRRTRWASTRTRKRSGSSATRSTSRGWGRRRFAGTGCRKRRSRRPARLPIVRKEARRQLGHDSLVCDASPRVLTG